MKYLQETKNILKNKPESQEIKIFCVGDKSRLALQRIAGQHFLATGNDIGMPYFSSKQYSNISINF